MKKILNLLSLLIFVNFGYSQCVGTDRNETPVSESVSPTTAWQNGSGLGARSRKEYTGFIVGNTYYLWLNPNGNSLTCSQYRWLNGTNNPIESGTLPNTEGGAICTTVPNDATKLEVTTDGTWTTTSTILRYRDSGLSVDAGLDEEICLGDDVQLNGNTNDIESPNVGFSNCKDVSNWSIRQEFAAGNGTVDVSPAPSSIILTGPNGGDEGLTLYETTITVSGILSFTWNLEHDDPGYDTFGYEINGTPTPITNTDGSGVVSINLNNGDVFGFYAYSNDGIFGTFDVTITNLESFCTINPVVLWSGGPITSGGTTLTPTVNPITTSTYTITATVGTCSVSDNVLVEVTDCSLPVELTQFSASCINHKTNLYWETATELNTSHWIIEKSHDGERWIKIDSIDAQGTTNNKTTYNYIDPKRNIGTIYYRLHQFDFDGENEIFGPVSNLCEGNRISVELFPNPVNNILNLKISLPSGSEKITIITLLNTTNKKVGEKVLNLEISNLIKWDLTDLQSGVYFFRICNPGYGCVVKKFIKN